MNLKALMLVLSLLSTLAIQVLPTNAGITVPNPLRYTYITTTGPKTCDPACAYDTPSSELIMNIYQCLIDFNFVYHDQYVEELADWWPGKGVNQGNVIQPLPPDPWQFDNTTLVDLHAPIGSKWTRKCINWHLTAWVDNGDGILGYCDNVTMRWLYDPLFPVDGWEYLEFHVDKVIVLCDTYYKLILQPLFFDSTWKFHIREGMKWQDPAYGTVNPFDVEVTFERGMIMDFVGGPQWMFFVPLTPSHGTRDGTWNWPGYSGYDPTLPDQTAMLARWIDDSIESDLEFVWFNLDQPYIKFMQILCQSWGSVMCADWLRGIGAWDLGWHCPCHTFDGYLSWIAYSNPPSPGPVGAATMGSGPYYVDYVDLFTGYFRLRSFDNYYFGWTKPHCDTIIHEVELSWFTRRDRFLSDHPDNQADQVTVLKEQMNDPYLLAAIEACKVRYLPNLPTLSADAIFYSYDFDDSAHPHWIGTPGGFVKNSTLLSDIHMRLALTYCWNATEFINDYYLGEAATLHNPIVYGIAYANATKHATMFYEKNIAKATYHFKMAWGGIDADGDWNTWDDVTPGLVWQYGFKVAMVPFPIVASRTMPCYMIEYVVENEIPWEVPAASVDVIVDPHDLAPGLTDLFSGLLGSYVLGGTDFPNTDTWVRSFMHTNGALSQFQNIHYGHDMFGNPVVLNWHPWGNYFRPEINNTYVDGLIEAGLVETNPAVAEKIYTELMDIYYAECASRMTVQPIGRHYERTWVYGWFFNSFYPGKMFYGEDHTMNIFKVDPQAITCDAKPSIRFWYRDTPTCWELHIVIDISWFAEYPEYLTINMTWWDRTGGRHTETKTGWLEAGGEWEYEATVLANPVWGGAAKAEVAIGPWVGHFRVDCDLTNNKLTAMTARVPGDLGGLVNYVPKYWAFDGKCSGADVALFINAFRWYVGTGGTNPYA